MIAESTKITSLDELLGYFDKPVRRGSGYNVICPCHHDREQSLSISSGNKGFVLKCQAGCDASDILDSVGLTFSDLFYESLPEPIPMRPRTIVATYNYTDENGEVLFQAVRYEPKSFSQRAPDGRGGWKGNVKGVRKVPYRLPELIAADPKKPVFICAGEKDADNVRSLGFVATTNAAGEGKGKWLPEFNDFLRDRNVVILCDNDLTGLARGTEIRSSLKGIAKNVDVVHFPELPEGGDVSDWIERGGSRASLIDRIKESREEVVSLSLPPFPIDIFPETIQQYLLDGAISTRRPVDMIAVPFLSFAASVIGNSINIKLSEIWYEKPIIWTAVSGRTGAGKTPALKYAQSPLDNLQKEAHDHHKNMVELFEAENPKAKKDDPNRPKLKDYMTTDATVEAIVKMLGRSRGLAMSQDELIGWIRSFEKFNKGGDRQFYLQLWSGVPAKSDRVSRESLYIPDPSVSITGGIQPSLIPDMAKGGNIADGLIQRFLITCPDIVVTPRASIFGGKEGAVTDIFRTLATDIRPQDTITLLPSRESMSTFHAWEDENYRITETAPEITAGFYAKYNGYVGRIALVLHMLHTAGNRDHIVPEERFQDAIVLIEYFRAHLNSVLPLFDVPPSSDSAGKPQRVMRALAKTPGEWVARRDLMIRLGNNIPSRDLEPILNDLDATGAIEQRVIKHDGPGRPKHEARSTPKGVSELVL